MVAITRRIFIEPIAATAKPSAIRCRDCGARSWLFSNSGRALALPARDAEADVSAVIL